MADTEVITKPKRDPNEESQFLGISIRAYLAGLLCSVVAFHIIISDIIAYLAIQQPPKIDAEVMLLISLVLQFYFQKTPNTNPSNQKT